MNEQSDQTPIIIAKLIINNQKWLYIQSGISSKWIDINEAINLNIVTKESIGNDTETWYNYNQLIGLLDKQKDSEQNIGKVLFYNLMKIIKDKRINTILVCWV